MSFSPAEVARNYLTIGRAKAEMPAFRQLLLGIMAGMFIALAGMASIFGNVYVNKALGAAIFPAGLAMVLVAGSELFTGNCLLILPLLQKEIRLAAMLRNWLVVYAGNLIGALAVTGICVGSGLRAGPVAEAAAATAAAKAALPFAAAFFRGVGCNILVCIAVWMSFAAKDVAGKVLAVFFPIMAFVICGFEHSVANMFYLPFGGAPLMGCIRNLIPVTLGNIVGGGFVAAVYWRAYLKGKKE